MAVRDVFDTGIITHLNGILQQTCKNLEFFYIFHARYGGSRKIGIRYKGASEYEALSHMDLTGPEEGTIKIGMSKTATAYLGNNFNKCLRFLAAIIAATERCYLSSDAVSPASLHLMYAYFNSEIKIGDAFVPKAHFSPADIKAMLPHDTSGRYARFVTIRAVPDDIGKLLHSLATEINKIRCEGFGGSRKSRKSRNSRKSRRI